MTGDFYQIFTCIGVRVLIETCYYLINQHVTIFEKTKMHCVRIRIREQLAFESLINDRNSLGA